MWQRACTMKVLLISCIYPELAELDVIVYCTDMIRFYVHALKEMAKLHLSITH